MTGPFRPDYGTRPNRDTIRRLPTRLERDQAHREVGDDWPRIIAASVVTALLAMAVIGLILAVGPR